MKYVKCNLCGADDFIVVFPKGYAQLHQIVRCRQCGLMYANPQEHVDCEELAAHPEPGIYDPTAPHNRQYFQKQQNQLPDNLRALQVLDEVIPQRGRLLEIGSFTGRFLDRIRADGWETVGLEPYRSVAQYARAKYGLEIIEGLLPNPALPDAHFDAVVLLHVIEHMPDPAANLREIRRILKPGGVVVVETPRFNSLMFKLLGRRERSIQNCQGHIFFFTENTLQRLLQKCGLSVFRAERVGRTLSVDRLLGNVGLVTRCVPVQRWLGRIGPALNLDRVILHVNLRDMQRAYARAV
jgi:SAM-dependent methyltransferase